MSTIESIKQLMTSDVITISAELTLAEAKHVFRKHKIRHLPVMKNDELIGILSFTDLQRISFVSLGGSDEMTADSELMENFTVGQIMKEAPVTVTSDQPITEVMEILAEKEFHALPVMSKGKLAGIVTTTDLIQYMLKKELI